MSENLNPIVLEVEEVRVVNAVSPTVDLGRTETGALVTVHDYRGTQTVEILDGPVGPVGPQGPQGESGAETARAIVEETISRMEDSIHDAQIIGQTVAGYRDAAAQSASNAALSKDAAALSAQAAEQSNQSSSGYARTAGEQAENAAQSAQAASQSATAADTSKHNAAQSETNAGNSAQAADRSAQAASQSASNAAQSERNAADSAQDAQDVLDSIPADYSALSSDVTGLKSAFTQNITYGANQLFLTSTTWFNGYLGSDGVLVTSGRTITPTSAPIKLDSSDKVVVNCGSLVCGVAYFRYNTDIQRYTRHYSVDKTGEFEIVSDGDNFYYGLMFKKNPQTAITPDEFDGYIGKYTDWRLKIDENATKLSADGMVDVFKDLTQWTAGYFGSNGVITPSSYRCTPLSTPFLFYAGDTIEIDPGTFSCGVAVYTYTSGTYARQSSKIYTEKTTITYATDKYISFDFGKTPAGQTPATEFTGYIKYSVAWKTKIYNNSSRISALETAAASGNYLAGKKLVACGDSITAAVNPGGGNFDSYARLTAQRNGMTFDLNAVSGSTMTNVSGRNPFCVDRYQQIPSDFDYLTIWFGFNDGAYAQVGTINDTEDTTFYGAYKKVMDYYLATYPTKKIGLIVPYMSNAAFQQAVRDISEMYGVPCLDLPDYNQCSIVWGDANAAQSARKSALTYDGTHPNQTGHEFISTMYEAFLRRL